MAFRKVPPERLALLDEIRQDVELRSGEGLNFDKFGRPGFYCIRGGHLRIDSGSSTRPQTIRICGPGDLVGYQTTKENYFVTALGPCRACFFDREDFDRLHAATSDFALGIIDALLAIISIKDERIVGLENHTVRNRVAAALISLSKKFGIPSPQGTLVDVNIDRTTLAKLSGTVVESLARTLTEFEKEKIISAKDDVFAS